MCFSVGRICSAERQKKRKVKLFRRRRIGKSSGLLIRLARIVGSSPTAGAKYNAPIAHSVERLPCKQEAVGSKPAGGTTYRSKSLPKLLLLL